MKRLFIIPLFLILFSCNSKSNTTQTRKDSVFKGKTDTVVEAVTDEIAGADYIEKECFVVVKNDTSSFSCIVTENKINGKMSMHCRRSQYGKITTSFSLHDTAAVAKHEPVKKFNHTSYKEQIRELKLILNYASKDYDLSKLSSVGLAMSSVNDLSQSITRQYISQYGERFPAGSNEKAAALIENAQFTTDLNNILSPYSVIVNEISIDGLMYYIPQDSPAGTKLVLDGIAIFKLAPIH